MNRENKKTINSPKTEQILVWMTLGVATALFILIYGNLAQDDAYITYRYARNLANGYGFVYNQNEWVLGTTTPLYTLILAISAYLSKLDIVKLSSIFSGISLWVSAGVLYELGRLSDSKSSFLLALIFITNPFLSNFIGMESFILLCFLLLTIWSYINGKVYISSICNGLLILVRYEMIFLSIIIGVLEFKEKRKLPYWLLPGFVIVFIWLVYATLVFGSPIPLSASAKLIAPQVSFLFGGVVYWYQKLLEAPAFFITIIFSLFGIFGTVLYKRSFKEYKIVILFSVVYLIVASFFAGAFPWYYAPLIPGFSITVIFGINYISRINSTNSPKLIKNKHNWNFGLSYILAILLVIVQLSFWINSYQTKQGEIGDIRYEPYKLVSEWLIRNASPEESIATFEIGYVGYLSHMRIIDLAGLVTPELFRWVGGGTDVSLIHAIRIFSPDYILILENWDEQREIMNDADGYQKVEESFNGYFLYRKR